MIDLQPKLANPEGCTCGLLWQIRKIHGKRNCPHLVHPYPGSPQAVADGCECPVKQNDHGKGFLQNRQLFYWISGRCTLHGEMSN